MTKLLRELRTAVGYLVILGVLFGAGFLVGRYYGLSGEVLGPLPSAEEKVDLTLPQEVEKRVITKEEVEIALVETSQFSTYTGEYTTSKSAEYTRYMFEDMAIPGTTNRIELDCRGIVKVGYQVEDIAIAVDNDRRSITISLPQPTVLDNYIIWDSVRYKEANNILNPIDFEQYQVLIGEIEADGLALVEADGIYEKAEENMKTIIRGFLSAFEEFQIVFS